MVDLVRYVYSHYPRLKKELLEAHMTITPQLFIQRTLKTTTIYSMCLAVGAAFLLSSRGYPPVWSVGVFVVGFFFMLNLNMQIPKISIKRRGKEMNNEVLFAGRFLLIKISSGRPLFNALIDASQSYGIASKYFKEIVDSITFGTPIEEALDKATEISPSPWFKKLLFQISNSLKTGTDVTHSLAATIEEIEAEQAIEIERYGKKLSSMAMFYMLLAIVVPSLGLTMFVVVTALLSIPIPGALYIVLSIFIIMMQLIFISLFKSIRPSVNF